LVGRAIETLFMDSSKEAILRRLDENLQSQHGPFSDEPLLAALVTPNPDVEIAQIKCARLVVDGTVLVGVLLDDTVTTQLDPLTPLRDRNYLYARLFRLLASTDACFALLFVDLDNFKRINDQHGHLIGDRVLFEAAKRILVCVGLADPVTRYGGDEFVVLVENAGDAEGVQGLADRIQKAIAPPISVPGGEVTLSASVGIAISSPEYRTPNDVIAAADRAMYAAKRGK
jgi:diguanylate cyclase (GGDEF)-like protein